MTDDDVSRGTFPVPDEARQVLGKRVPLAAAYAELLATDGVARGLIGPREGDRLWHRHLLNCAVVTELMPGDATVCDVGSGAGLPGLVVALRRPDLRVTLVDPLLRRTTFLQEAVERLGLTNVEVVRERAEAMHGSRAFDVVTSRAVAPLPRLLAWSLPLLRPGGTMVAMKGASARDELAAASEELLRWRTAGAEVLELGRDAIDPPTTVIRVETASSTPLGWSPTQRPGARQGSGRRARRRGRPGDGDAGEHGGP